MLSQNIDIIIPIIYMVERIENDYRLMVNISNNLVTPDLYIYTYI